MLFRDEMECGHTQVVDVVAPVDPLWRIGRTLNTPAFCVECPKREGGFLAISMVIASTAIGPS